MCWIISIRRLSRALTCHPLSVPCLLYTSFEGLLADGGIDAIREYLKENIHQYGKLKTSRQILKDVTGEDFNPEYYVRYLKEKYTRIYDLK